MSAKPNLSTEPARATVSDRGGPRPRVGIVGVGRMGLPMARHATAAGFEVIAFDLDPAATGKAAAAGARTASSLADVAAGSDVVLVVVPTDADVVAVCAGDGGLLETAPSGAVIAICSSVLPETVRSVAALAAARGVGVLDSPLTKGVHAAEAGTMTVLVGGETSDLDKARRVLDCFSLAIHHLGPVGAGQIGKTVNNLLLWVQLAAVRESLELGAKLGVRPERLRAALEDCSADSWVLRELSRIRPTWPEKDMQNALRMAAGAGCSVPIADAVAARAHEFSAEAVRRLLAL